MNDILDAYYDMVVNANRKIERLKRENAKLKKENNVLKEQVKTKQQILNSFHIKTITFDS